MASSRNVALVVVILFAATLVRAENPPKKNDCGNLGGTMVEINDCAAEQFKQADDELNRLFQAKMAALETAGSKNRLRDAQRAWISFRDKACLYEAGPREDSGSVWPLEHFGCMERQTQKRILDLKRYVACTMNGCPN